MRDSLTKLLNSRAELNFTIIRDNEEIGEAQCIPVEQTNYLHVIRTDSEIIVGDCLVDKNGKKITIIESKRISGIQRIYYSD